MDKTSREHSDRRHSCNQRRQHKTIEMALGTSYKQIMFYGEDGVMRSAQLKTKNSALHRPAAKLCVLEEAT